MGDRALLYQPYCTVKDTFFSRGLWWGNLPCFQKKFQQSKDREKVLLFETTAWTIKFQMLGKYQIFF